MKKIVYILIGIFTFSIGFGSYLFRPFVTPVSLCEISQNAELYRSKQIKIKAYLDRASIYENEEENFFSVFSFDSECLTGAHLEIAEELKTALKNNKNLRNFINELSEKQNEMLEKRDDSGFYIAEVEIVGEIETGARTSHSPPFIIKAEKIRQLSPISFLTREEILKLPKN